jgi:hypothetical protein
MRTLTQSELNILTFLNGSKEAKAIMQEQEKEVTMSSGSYYTDYILFLDGGKIAIFKNIKNNFIKL